MNEHPPDASNMGCGFNCKELLFEAVEWYANDEIYAADIQISIPGCEWKEFKNSKLFRDIVQYAESLKEKYKPT